MSRRVAVAGVDGCRAGWIVAVLAADDVTPLEVRVLPRLDELVAEVESGRLGAAAVDIPIGLAARGRRACDVAARRMLGPRRSSIFPAPARGVLGATTYAQACARSYAACGKKVSTQLFNIVPKIREVDRMESPALQQQLFEACPELSFAFMAGGTPMGHAKRTSEGRSERLAALYRAGFGDVAALVERPPAGAGPDDVCDALALAWTARRQVAGNAVRVGGEADDTGLRMEITI